MFKRVLVFAAHADDELAMAGTIGKFVQEGTEVYIVLMTDGSEGYPEPDMKETIVETRKREAAACDEVLGTAERVFLDEPDMGLQHKKDVVLKCMREIRRFRPDAIFTQGGEDNHPDHRATHRITIDAQWQAGQPVCAELGEPWRTPIVYYYKGVSVRMPRITIDVSETAYKRQEALATQVSQHTLFGTTREQFLARAEDLRRNPQKAQETFWIAECNSFNRFFAP